MNETVQFIIGGALFATLGVLSLRIKGITRGTLILILGFLLITVLVAALFGVKYIFINGLFFGMASMFYVGIALTYKLNKECSNLIELSKQENEDLPKESSSEHLQDTDLKLRL